MGLWVLQNTERPDTESCQALLDRILSSPQLRRSTRMRELLAYVGRRTFKDGCEQLHEQEIGTNVFGRSAGYDTSVDNIVRVNATELRKRIEAYFETEGINEPLVMEIPRGSYIPAFRYRPVESVPAADFAAPAPAQEAEAPVAPNAQPQLLPLPASAPHLRRWPWIAGTIVAVVATLVLAALCLRLSLDNRAMHKRLFPWEYQPAVSAFWTEFLGANATTDVVLSDTAFAIFQAISKRSYSLQDFLNRSYVNELQKQSLDPQARATLQMLAGRTLVSGGEFTLAEHLDEMDPLNTQVHMYFAGRYNPAFLKRNNVVLIGTRLSNPWMQIFESRLLFPVESNPEVVDPEGVDYPRQMVMDRAPAAGEQATYTPSEGVEYCSVSYLANSEHTGRVLLIEGTNSEAAEGCGDFLLSEPGMESLLKKLNGGARFPYFQALLRTSQLIDTPIAATLVAVRNSPNMH
jgi:hypothetical protein